ncbi:hypothetical protein VCHA34P131_80064 [Vibrio chagasii]|nr:hypothetical protein VCHA34P131_80064 [Vibrio chagasii]CAH7055688.1 hypothetical protein VCHA40P238_10239 [Vibrio chagasii]CAH7162983.1 hypothetical protein VCHA37P199_240008 [Vibrio chagasii]CAH7259035.1 hypothetical protein VCHA52P456_340003 [Vibrio chagasii]CAH7294315.1 hypothetical protein VCHA39P226_430008 [Vibrio chagasii]
MESLCSLTKHLVKSFDKAALPTSIITFDLVCEFIDFKNSSIEKAKFALYA